MVTSTLQHVAGVTPILEIQMSGVPVTMSSTNQFVPDIREIVPVTTFWLQKLNMCFTLFNNDITADN